MPDVFSDFIIPGLPGPLMPPTDRTVSSNTTLSQRLNYFRNLTITGSSTLTGVAGGTIIVVQQKLQIDSGSLLSVNALGGKGGAALSPGFGGGAYGRAIQATRTDGGFIQSSVNAFAVAPVCQAFMASGGAGGSGATGGAGGAWPFATGGLVGADATEPQDLDLWLAILELIRAGNQDNATSGAIGGGGGAGGSGGTAAAGIMGGKGGVASDGGSGFGGGGGGGSGSTTAGSGGRGGGVVLILCGVLSGSGTISANGANGSNGVTNGGGGGGGGGGAVCVAYHIADATTPTLQANGGSGGTLAGTGRNGGQGGAGVATSFRVNVGIATTI